MRPALTAAALATALLACRTHGTQRPAASPTPAAAAAARPAPAHPAPPPSRAGAAPAEEPQPLLQLPEEVRPLRYALQLEVVPGRAEGFSGTAEIEIELSAPRTVLWMHAHDLRVTRAEVEATESGTVAGTFAQVNGDGLAKLTLPAPVGPGRATLRFAWQASWNGQLSGLYLARTGGEAYAATQLEAIDARRVFPGFDEPRFKTPFDVTLTVPAAAAAVSNAPVASEEAAGDGLRRVRFATTDPLPTYLLFLAVGPFDVVTPPPLPPNEVRARPLPVRLLAPKGHGAELAFAAEATAAIVPWFERYFGIAFPYAKLDQIAVPEFAAGAMENAGAIAYRSSLLLDSKATSDENRLGIAAVMAHEIAHEWFGDLVTLPWWTDTWLNESFATWAGERATSALRPGWSADAEAFRHLDEVMDLDGAASARAIRQPLLAMSDVWSQFDGMSYSKGASVLRTFERFAGEARFREGVRAYLSSHRHGTGTSDAFFADLSRAAGVPLAPALAGFTDRPGVPLVSARVSCEPGRARLLLTQTRFVPRGSDAARGEAWRLPVCARWEAAGAERLGCVLLEGPEGALELGEACPSWVMPHAGGASYHRWTLAPPDLAKLRSSGLRRLSAVEKISLARNLRAAQQSGATPWTDAMLGIAALAHDPDPDAAAEPAAVLALLHDRLVPHAARPGVAALARRLYGPVLARLGWEPRRGELLATGKLREAALQLLALTAGEPAIRTEAAQRGRALLGLDGAPPRPGAIDPGLATIAIAAAIREGGAPALDAVVARLATVEDASLRQKIVQGLGLQADPALAARAAALWRGGVVKPHEFRYLFVSLSSLSAGRAAILGEVERDLDGLARAVPSGAIAFLPALFSGGCDAASAARVRAALEPRLDAHPEMRRKLSQALEQIRICAAEREADGPAAAAFFAGAARGARAGR
jgi:cytosol alanyl aminopeptidase